MSQRLVTTRAEYEVSTDAEATALATGERKIINSLQSGSVFFYNGTPGALLNLNPGAASLNPSVSYAGTVGNSSFVWGSGSFGEVHGDIIAPNGGDLSLTNSAKQSGAVLSNGANWVFQTPGIAVVNAPCALVSLNTTAQGLLMMRMTKVQRNAIPTPLAGLAVYQTDNTPGLRVYNGTNWMRYTETAD